MFGEGVEPPRQLGIEKGGECLIFLDQFQDQNARQQVAKRFLLRDKACARRSMDNGLAIEGILRAKQGLGFLADFLGDRAFDNDVEEFGASAPLDNHAAGSEIANVDCPPQRFRFSMC